MKQVSFTENNLLRISLQQLSSDSLYSKPESNFVCLFCFRAETIELI